MQVKMITNVTPKEKKRTFEIYPEIPLNKYIELYEQTFDIDLYAYRVSFRHKDDMISKLEEIKDLKNIKGDV